jgi:hypothetical protein
MGNSKSDLGIVELLDIRSLLGFWITRFRLKSSIQVVHDDVAVVVPTNVVNSQGSQDNIISADWGSMSIWILDK